MLGDGATEIADGRLARAAAFGGRRHLWIVEQPVDEAAAIRDMVEPGLGGLADGRLESGAAGGIGDGAGACLEVELLAPQQRQQQIGARREIGVDQPLRHAGRPPQPLHVEFGDALGEHQPCGLGEDFLAASLGGEAAAAGRCGRHGSVS